MGFYLQKLKILNTNSRYGEDARQGSNTGRSGWQLLIATFRHMRNPYQMLIAPLTIWSGFEQAFLQADFTAVC